MVILLCLFFALLPVSVFAQSSSIYDRPTHQGVHLHDPIMPSFPHHDTDVSISVYPISPTWSQFSSSDGTSGNIFLPPQIPAYEWESGIAAKTSGAAHALDDPRLYNPSYGMPPLFGTGN